MPVARKSEQRVDAQAVNADGTTLNATTRILTEFAPGLAMLPARNIQ
jgi:hypothetical protein